MAQTYKPTIQIIMKTSFITAVSMACTQEQYERDLRKPLLEMGYREQNFNSPRDHTFLINNLGGEMGSLSNVALVCKDDYNRYFIDHYNPELYLALAAMTNEPFGIVGEWWVYIGWDDDFFTGDALYKGLRPINLPKAFLDDRNLTNGYGRNPLEYFRKATKEEIINHLTKSKMEKKDLREMLQSGRIIELRNGEVGIIIQTYKGLLVQYETCWGGLSSYNSELKSNSSSRTDIIRVRVITNNHHIIRECFEEAPIIWEREETKKYTIEEVLKMAGIERAQLVIESK